MLAWKVCIIVPCQHRIIKYWKRPENPSQFSDELSFVLVFLREAAKKPKQKQKNDATNSA
jgi:hypothetical protein